MSGYVGIARAYVAFVLWSEAVDFLHKMTCKSLIRDLEDGAHDENLSENEVKDEIVRLGEQYQIAFSETSFVAVDDGNWTEANGMLQGGGKGGGHVGVLYDADYYDAAVGFFEDCEISIIPTVSMLTCLFDVALELLLVMI